jgi:signal transduction histidine kinase
MSQRRSLIRGLGLISVLMVATTVVFDLTIHPAVEPHELWTNTIWGSAWILGGLIAWTRRPANGCGPLMALTGWSALIPHLSLDEPVSYTILGLLGGPTVAFLVHLLVVYPTGVLRTRFQRIVVAINYVGWICLPAFGSAWDRTNGCSDCPDNLLFIREDPQLLAITATCLLALIAFSGVSVAVLLIRRWVRATRPERRVLAPVLWTSALGLSLWLAWLVPAIWLWLTPDDAFNRSMFIATYVAGAAVPLAFLAGLLRTRLHRGAVAELVVELERAPASPEAAIVRALGDPRARLGFWLPEQRRYVDFDGHPVDLPVEGAGQAVKLLESAGSPLAVLIYDPALLEDRTLLDAVGSAARLSLENARLHAQLRAQLAEVRASRARIVEASDAERRKIERNLHDGAQQRLLGIRLVLRVARSEVDDTAAMQTLLDEADAEVAATLDDLRRLARGIHPVVLEEAGLRPALDDLARRCPIPVAVTAFDERLPQPVEAAAYFVVSEALANVIKHAQARTATVAVVRENGRLIVDISDDGVGGARINGGMGLRNLHDRVAVLSGALTIHSESGCGTRIRAVIPCE